MTRLAPALFLFLLAACARTEDADSAQLDTNELQPSLAEAPAAGGEDDNEPEVGEWRQGLVQDRNALEFGPAGAQPLLTVVCAEAGGIVVQRHGVAPSGAAVPAIIVTVADQPRQLVATATPGSPPMLRATVPADDPLIAMIGSAQGPISVRSGDGAPLILPPSPLIAEFSTTCPAGRTARQPQDAASGNAATPTQ